MPQDFESFLPKLRIWIGDCRTYVINVLFFKLFWKGKRRRLETNLTFSLILRSNLRLGGTPYGVWFSLHPIQTWRGEILFSKTLASSSAAPLQVEAPLPPSLGRHASHTPPLHAPHPRKPPQMPRLRTYRSWLPNLAWGGCWEWLSSAPTGTLQSPSRPMSWRQCLTLTMTLMPIR